MVGKFERLHDLFVFIPFATLHDHLQSGNIEIPCLDDKVIFTVKQEKEIADHTFTSGQTIYGLHHTELHRFAYDYPEMLGVHHKFNRQTKLARVSNFMKQHLTIPLRKP
jgi:hypothetical protein